MKDSVRVIRVWVDGKGRDRIEVEYVKEEYMTLGAVEIEPERWPNMCWRWPEEEEQT